MFFLHKYCKFCNHETPDENINSANTQCRTADPRETLSQCRFNFGPPSTASAQLHLTNIGATSRVCWGHYTCGF